MGDVNADLLSPGGDAGIFKDLASKFFLKFMDCRPTHHVGTSHTFIDVICVDDKDVILDHKKMKSNFHNAHDTIHVTIETSITTHPLESFLYRKYRDITPLNLNRFFETCDWTALLSSDSIFVLQLGLNCLNKNLQVAIQELASLK